MTDPTQIAALDIDPRDDAIHGWFSLSYASYLTIPRSVLQSMPGEWQERFVALLGEMEARCYAHGVSWPTTEVRVRGERGKFLIDPLRDYERGRRNVFAETSDAT